MPEQEFDTRYRKRHLKDKLFLAVVVLPALAVLAILAFIILQVFANGARAFSVDFFTKAQKPFGDPGGGIANGIIGSIMILSIAALISIPLSLAAGLYLAENKEKKLARALHLTISSFQGVPSIVFGVVMYTWIVVPMKTFSALAGGIALSFIMIPTVTSSIREILLLVPDSYREAAISLGVPHWRAMTGVVLPAAASGIFNGIGLGIARIAGETAPLLFTAFGNPFVNTRPTQPTSAIPLIVYEYIKSPYEDWHQKAWGAAFLLVCFVFFINILISLKKEGPRAQ